MASESKKNTIQRLLFKGAPPPLRSHWTIKIRDSDKCSTRRLKPQKKDYTPKGCSTEMKISARVAHLSKLPAQKLTI